MKDEILHVISNEIENSQCEVTLDFNNHASVPYKRVVYSWHIKLASAKNIGIYVTSVFEQVKTCEGVVLKSDYVCRQIFSTAKLLLVVLSDGAQLRGFL